MHVSQCVRFALSVGATEAQMSTSVRLSKEVPMDFGVQCLMMHGEEADRQRIVQPFA